MRVKIACLIGLIVFFADINYIFGAPVYGGNMPSSKRWDIGLQGNAVPEHRMRGEQGEMRGRNYFFIASYGIWEWLCFDGKIGLGDITHKPDNEPKAEYDLNFAGGYGLRACVWQNLRHSQKVILGFQHISAHPGDVSVNNKKNEIIFDEWQASLLYAWQREDFYPYFGLKFSREDLIRRLDHERKRRLPAERGGVFIGTDYYLHRGLRLNLEARFVDEQAVSLAVIKSY